MRTVMVLWHLYTTYNFESDKEQFFLKGITTRCKLDQLDGHLEEQQNKLIDTVIRVSGGNNLCVHKAVPHQIVILP